MPSAVECFGGPLDGQARPVAMYGTRWAVWAGTYTLSNWRGRTVYVWQASC